MHIHTSQSNSHFWLKSGEPICFLNPSVWVNVGVSFVYCFFQNRNTGSSLKHSKAAAPEKAPSCVSHSCLTTTWSCCLSLLLFSSCVSCCVMNRLHSTTQQPLRVLEERTGRAKDDEVCWAPYQVKKKRKLCHLQGLSLCLKHLLTVYTFKLNGN